MSMQIITDDLFSQLLDYQTEVLSTQQKNTLEPLFKKMVNCLQLKNNQNNIGQLKNRMFVDLEASEAEGAKKVFAICLKRCPDSMISSLLGLDKWKNNNNVGNTKRACEQIIECFKTQSLSLNLSNNGLRSLPDGLLKYFTQLQTLDLSNNQLLDLPSEIGQCTQLRRLNCHHNFLFSLPPEIGQCVELRELNCYNTRISSLPCEIGQCVQLRELICHHSWLTSLPSEIGLCAQLRKLDCSFNQLRSLPTELNQCTQLNRVIHNNNEFDHLGVQWMPFNGFQQFKNAATESSLKNLDENFFKSDPAVFQNILSWLDKLTTAKEFTDQKSRPYFAERVLSILQFAQTNPEYFETFKAFLIGALGSCVDRASLPLNYLELQKKIHESKDDSLENLIAIFKGGLALDQIPFIASKFMESHSEADEIEVHLGLQTKMKEIFNLPIALSSMNYFGCSHLKEKDLDEAEIQIKNALQDKEKAVNYLISNKIWEEKLKTLFREDLDTSLSGIQKELKKLNKKYSSEKEKMLEQDFIKACADLKDKHVQLEKAWILDRTIEVVEMHWLPNTSNYIITDLF